MNWNGLTGTVRADISQCFLDTLVQYIHQAAARPARLKLNGRLYGWIEAEARERYAPSYVPRDDGCFRKFELLGVEIHPRPDLPMGFLEVHQSDGSSEIVVWPTSPNG